MVADSVSRNTDLPLLLLGLMRPVVTAGIAAEIVDPVTSAVTSLTMR